MSKKLKELKMTRSEILKERSPDPGLPGCLSQRFDAHHSELLGRILTTLEIAVDDKRKLKSLKDRVHETQTWFWAEMKWRKYLGIIFEANRLNSKFVEEQPQDLEKFTRPIKSQIEEYVIWMLGPSKREETFAKVLANLVALAVSEFKVQPLVKELNRLIGLTSASLRRDLCHTVDYVFKEKQGAAR